MNTIRALEALQATVRLLGPGHRGALEDQMANSLATLSGAVGASRACWCFVASDSDDAVVEAYLTGGDPLVPPVGPSALGRSLRLIPELQPLLGHDTHFVVVETSQASTAFGAIVRSSNADWVASTASEASGSGQSVLFLAGRGAPPDPELLHGASLSAISALMRATVHTPTPEIANEALNDELMAIFDALDVGIISVDGAGRALSANTRAASLLGLSKDALRGRSLSPADWHWWVEPADALQAGTISAAATLGHASPTPTIIRVSDRAGKTIRILMTLRSVAANNAHGTSGYVVTLQELPVDTSTDPDGAGEPDAGQGLAEVVGRLRSVLADLETFSGIHSLGRGALPESFGELTARETEIVGCLLEGVRVTTIAQRLYLSPHTVRNHLRSIFRKVGVASQAELIQLARGMRQP